MHLKDQVTPQREDFFAFANDYPADTPVVMINILKFKDKSGKGEESGREAYGRYSKNVAPLLAKVGGKVLWAGNVNQTVIGDTADQPDTVLIVQYPSKQAFISMSTSNEYRAISEDREIALEYGGLLASSTINPAVE